MPTSLQDHYSAGFYAGQSADSYSGARALMPLVLDAIKPASVIDLGCGVGTWLAAIRELGVPRVVGVEGAWVQREQLRDPAIELWTRDLSQPLTDQGSFDLAMSLEVAEHLPAARANGFVAELCRFAPVVLFGAAIPGQGGINHINEQWQQHWVDLFDAQGYDCLDVIRPAVWSDRRIPVHYRQNTFLFVNRGQRDSFAPLLGSLTAPRAWPIDQIHPEIFSTVIAERERPRTLGEILMAISDLPSALARSAQSRLGGGRRT